MQLVLKGSFLLGLIALATGCIVAEPRHYDDGYYDRDHHRYWHENRWHDCGDHSDYCR
jgi:hypothetical protein